MKTLTKLVQYVLWSAIALIIYEYALAEEPEINWYTRPGNTNESILEICYDNGCHKLIHKNESTDKEHIIEWALDIDKIEEKIKDKHEQK